MWAKRLLIGGLFFAIGAMSLHAAVPVGKMPATVTLSGDDGGRVSGEPWSSSELKDKVHVLLYVDPDEKELNKHVEQMLKETFETGTFQSVAVINMDATWLPNAAIRSSIESKQEEFPQTIYVLDMEKILVDKWGIGDDTYAIAVFDKGGKVVFSKDGKLSDGDMQKMVKAIRDNL